MIPILLPIGALLTGIALLLLGMGLLNTLLALRGSAEGFSDQTLGLLGSAYFIGFILGTWLCPKLIRRMGHIRAFAFLAAATATCVLLHVLIIDAVTWFILRVITGTALVGIYTVIESWLNTQAPAERRGRVFAVYMAINLGSLALAQQLLRIDSPLAFSLFAISAIFIILGLMPVAATRLKQPTISDTPSLSLKLLWRAAPIACAGALLSGLAMGGFWGLGAVYAGRLGMSPADIALFISLVIVAGALFQWPMGILSDRIDRRRALAIIAMIAALGGVLMILLSPYGLWFLFGAGVFGAGAFAVYPAVVAHLIDHLHQDEILSGNAALLMLHGVGAALGPATAGWIMSQTTPHALPVYFSTMFVLCAVYSHIQTRRMRDSIVEESAHYVPMVRTSPVVLEMMLDDQTPDEPTDKVTDLEMEPHPGTEEALQEEPAEQENTPKTPLDIVSHEENTDPSNDTDKPGPTDR